MHLWDVGAFNGFLTLLMRKAAGRDDVLAIEPDSVNRGQLLANLHANGFEDVAVLPVAIGARAGLGQVRRSEERPSQTTVIESDIGDCEIVALDDLLIRFPAPGLIKLDVEGAELDALAGASRLLHELRPVWILETHGSAGVQALDRLKAAKYNIARIGKWNAAAAQLIGGGIDHFVATPT